MASRRRTRRWPLLALLALLSTLAFSSPLSAMPGRPEPAAQAGPAALQAAFQAAAHEFGVPEPLLLALSFQASRWETHGGALSASGGYGPMHLRHVDLPPFDGRGDGAHPSSQPDLAGSPLRTLDAAAALLGLPAEALKRDSAQN